MRSLIFRAGVVGLLLVGCAASSGCDLKMAANGDLAIGVSGSRASDTWVRSYTIAPGGRLEVINVNGEVAAEASDGNTVEVRAERSAQAGSDEAAKEFLNRIEMREEVGADRVRVETVVPPGRRGNHAVTFAIRVPAGVHVDLRTINGGVRLANVGGDVRVSTTNGAVRGRIAAASIIDARTTNGGVELEMTGALAPDGRVSLTSVNGGVALNVPDDTRAQVRARCINGRVSIDDGLTVTVDGEQSRRRFDGTMNGGGGRIELQTTNGGVSLGRSQPLR